MVLLVIVPSCLLRQRNWKPTRPVAQCPVPMRRYSDNTLLITAESLLAHDNFVMRPLPAAHWQTLHANALSKK
jgi:hypothetical protein